eukprot:1345628-Amorphochlora_amoeboformis.AAC.1
MREKSIQRRREADGIEESEKDAQEKREYTFDNLGSDLEIFSGRMSRRGESTFDNLGSDLDIQWEYRSIQLRF